MGDRTLDTVIEDLKGRGFVERFRVAGNQLRAIDSGRTFDGGDVMIREYQRFEGMSDPDDASVIYAIETQDGTKGLLVDAFGPYADPEVGRFLEGVRFLSRHSPLFPGSSDCRDRTCAPG